MRTSISKMAKRNSLSIVQKLNIISEIEKGSTKKKDIANKYDIPVSSLSTIIKNKDKILKQSSVSQQRQNHKKIRFCDYSDLDDVTMKWMTAIRQKNLPISGPLLQQKAKEFALALGHTDFAASNGWLHKFKKRHNIMGKVVCGEGGDANMETSDNWINTVLPSLVKDYDLNDVFNADETGLFFKCLPSRTLAFKNEKCVGGEKSKERITVMLGSNFTGTEKLKLLVIGKSKNPRCFRGLKSLEVNYENNAKSWMTSDIFEKWLIKLDNKFAHEKRKILMFVDNCPAHPKNVQTKLTNIKLAFFPPNMTSSLQPMDQGIINNLKQAYRKRILKKILDMTEDNKLLSISLLDAIRELSKAWVIDVKAETITNCFKKAGFAKSSNIELVCSDDESNIPLAILRDFSNDSTEDMSLKEIWAQITVGIPDLSLEEFLEVDNDLMTMDHQTDEDILASVLADHYGIAGTYVISNNSLE